MAAETPGQSPARGTSRTLAQRGHPLLVGEAPQPRGWPEGGKSSKLTQVSVGRKAAALPKQSTSLLPTARHGKGWDTNLTGAQCYSWTNPWQQVNAHRGVSSAPAGPRAAVGTPAHSMPAGWAPAAGTRCSTARTAGHLQQLSHHQNQPQ